MKPGDHPEFFRFPPPEGQSRESTIRLDAHGRFFHDGEVVEHDKLARGLHSWIAFHPDDGRPILTNGYDWTYFLVDDTLYFVTGVDADGASFQISDGRQVPIANETPILDDHGTLFTRVTCPRSPAHPPVPAKFLQHAQLELGARTVERNGKLWFEAAGLSIPIVPGSRKAP